MAEDVRIFVEDPSDSPVAGVYVGLHDSSTKALLQADFTDAEGIVTFPAVDEALNDGVYEIRVKPATPGIVTYGAVQQITVLLAGNNNFDVEVSFADLPVATSPSLCRVSGYFVDHTGQILPSVTLAIKEHFGFNLDRVVGSTYQTRAIIPSTVHVRSDVDGFFQFDLYRCAEYAMVLQGYDETARYVKVPDAASVNIADLLFTYVNSVTYTDEDNVALVPAIAPVLAMAIGEVVTLTYKVTARSGISLVSSEVVIDSPDSDNLVVSQAPNETVTGELTITAIAAGSYSLVLTRKTDSSSAFLGTQLVNDYPVIGALTINVA